ncbi:MAG TPA: DUF1161 domain-containing protein [Rhodanobacter sp.]
MNKRFGIVALLLLASPLMAHASCDEVKSGIDAKIKAKGVSSYTLEVVSADQAAADGKVVGQCEGDKKIVYTRGNSTVSDAAATDTTAPPKHHRHAMKKAADEAPAAASSSGG